MENRQHVLESLLHSATQITGAAVCLYYYEPVLLGGEQENRRVHYCPWCRLNLELDGRRACPRQDAVLAHEKALALEDCFLKKCHAGVMEAVIPVFYGAALSALVFLGQCRSADDDIPAALQAQIAAAGIPEQRMREIYEALPVVDEALLMHTATLLHHALQRCADTQYELFSSYMRDARSYVAEAKSFMHANVLDPSLRSRDIAEHLGLSREYLARLFRSRAGMTLTEYMQRLRCDRAKLLLANTESSVSRVAEQCGFEDANYFARVFRTATGQSPGAYRSRHRA